MNALLRPVILVYHGLGEVDHRADPDRLVVRPRYLEAHVLLLRRLGYRFLTAEELLAETEESPPMARTAVLTFDDGWRSWLTVGVPLLERLGVRGTFFVCPGWWGGQHPRVPGEGGRLLTEDEARALLAAGMDLGSHSMTHRDLRSLGDGELSRELVESKERVEALTDRPCRTFAYPFGLYDERVVSAAAAAGYELAFGWLPGRWRRMAAPRLPGPPRNGAGRLALKLLGIHRPGR